MAIALRGTDRCYHHQRDRERKAYRDHLRGNSQKRVMEAMELPPLETAEDIQICISNLFHAVVARHLNDHEVQQLLSILRIASRNLRLGAEQRKAKTVDTRSTAARVAGEANLAPTEPSASPVSSAVDERPTANGQ
jgi:hypothetical protein